MIKDKMERSSYGFFQVGKFIDKLDSVLTFLSTPMEYFILKQSQLKIIFIVWLVKRVEYFFLDWSFVLFWWT